MGTPRNDDEAPKSPGDEKGNRQGAVSDPKHTKDTTGPSESSKIGEHHLPDPSEQQPGQPVPDNAQSPDDDDDNKP
jgi:hypothetical protein